MSDAASPRSILVIEDDRATRALLTGQLRQMGHAVTDVGRLSEAREKLAEGQHDLVIVDGLLPDGTGLDFVQRLRDTGFGSPILFLSSFFNDMASHKVLREKLGVATVLRKPISIEALCGHVERALQVA